LSPVSVSVLLPRLLSMPQPDTLPAKLSASLRLKASVPSLTTSPAMEPVVPPLPSWSVPAEMVVPPW